MTMMKTNGILRFIILFIGLQYYNNISAQALYNDIKADQREKLYDNEFNKATDWTIAPNYKDFMSGTDGALCLKARVKDGKSYGSYTYTSNVNIEENRNFEIEAAVALPAASGADRFGFFWGSDIRKDVSIGYCIATDKGATNYCAFSGPIERSCQTGKSVDTKNLIEGYFQKITIRKISELLYVFVNEKLISIDTFQGFKGKFIGIFAYRDKIEKIAPVRMDYLRVNYLKGDVIVNKPPLITILQPAQDRNLMLVPAHTFVVKGIARDDDGISDVWVNNTKADVTANGNFIAEIPLREGKNNILVKATDRKGAVGTKSFEMSCCGVSNVAVDSGKRQEKRVALVIGNGNYDVARSLPNPLNDADSITRRLESIGFNVVQCKDCNRTQLLKKIDEFGTTLVKDGVGFFFYAGHGIQINGINYLIPTDAKLQSKSDADYECINLARIIGKMDDAHTAVNIVVLDACRDNPFDKAWYRSATNDGFASMASGPPGSIIEFSTSPGKTAADGNGANGLYTEALLEVLNEPGLSLGGMFQKARSLVVEKSNGEQVPWELNLMLRDYFLIKK